MTRCMVMVKALTGSVGGRARARHARGSIGFVEPRIMTKMTKTLEDGGRTDGGRTDGGRTVEKEKEEMGD